MGANIVGGGGAGGAQSADTAIDKRLVRLPQRLVVRWSRPP